MSAQELGRGPWPPGEGQIIWDPQAGGANSPSETPMPPHLHPEHLNSERREPLSHTLPRKQAAAKESDP